MNKRQAYPSDLTDEQWALVEPLIPAAKEGGRERTTDMREVLNGVFYILVGGVSWRMMPHDLPKWKTVYHYFRAWKNAGVWTCIQRSMYQQARRQAGRAACPSVVIIGRSVGKDHRTRRHSGDSMRTSA